MSKNVEIYGKRKRTNLLTSSFVIYNILLTIKKRLIFLLTKNNKPDFRRDPTIMKITTKRMCRTISSTCFLHYCLCLKRVFVTAVSLCDRFTFWYPFDLNAISSDKNKKDRNRP